MRLRLYNTTYKTQAIHASFETINIIFFRTSMFDFPTTEYCAFQESAQTLNLRYLSFFEHTNEQELSIVAAVTSCHYNVSLTKKKKDGLLRI